MNLGKEATDIGKKEGANLEEKGERWGMEMGKERSNEGKRREGSRKEEGVK